MNTPLADKLRPTQLKDFVGQTHLVGKDKPVAQLLKTKHLHSLIFWGPPGCGKTTLARIISHNMDAPFHYLSAVRAGKNEMRTICEQSEIARKNVPKEQLSFSSETTREKMNTKNTPILFLDEIHRFNKAQQDYLLPFVENGTITLIGATTENPSFEVNSALLSRCRVYVLKPLEPEDISALIKQAAQVCNLRIEKKAKDFLTEFSNGDARAAINTIQIIKELHTQGRAHRLISLQLIKQVLQKKTIYYDKGADEHYNTISAFIKSMRASNSDAALYYLARMIAAGEDPKFIARRMVIFASEDIGLAKPTALVVANAVFRAVETIGYPEAQINLAHGVAYLCSCPKNRSSYEAYFQAKADVEKYGNLQIPLNLRNAPTKLMKELGYGSDYQAYTTASLLPDKLKHKTYLKNQPDTD